MWYADWDRQTEREIDVAPGSFLMVRRETLEAVGGFDEQLRLYFAKMICVEGSSRRVTRSCAFPLVVQFIRRAPVLLS